MNTDVTYMQANLKPQTDYHFCLRFKGGKFLNKL